MAGFLTRSLLQAFGARLRNARPVENPEIEQSAERINKVEGVCAGANLVLPRASLVAEYDVAMNQIRILHQEETWNADHSQAHPVLTRNSQGSYNYTFAASYLDQEGNAVATDITAARVTPMNANGQLATDVGITLVDARTLEIGVFEGTNPSDGRFWLEVL